jgi:hypothetical protein
MVTLIPLQKAVLIQTIMDYMTWLGMSENGVVIGGVWNTI